MEVLDSKFVSQLTRLFPKFSNCVNPEAFQFPKSLVQRVLGDGDLDRVQLYSEADKLYVPFNFDKKFGLLYVLTC